MGQIDKEFEEYLCWLSVIDINMVINILKAMPNDLDDDVNKSIVDVIKSSKKEFFKNSKKLHMPKNMIKECVKSCNDIINIRNKEYKKIKFKENNYEKIEELFPELEKMHKKTEEQLKELIKGIYIDKEKDDLKNKYLNNNVIITDKRINKWKNYFNEWKKASIEDFNNKAKLLGLNKDGTPNKGNNNTEEITIFKIVIYFRNNKLNNNTELIEKIIEYELKNYDVEKNIKIDNNELKKWQSFYYKWYYNKNKFKYFIKNIEILLKKICINRTTKFKNKIERTIFISAIEDSKLNF